MAEMIEAKNLKPGHTIFGSNGKDIFLVLENTFNKTAMRQGIVKAKVKNLRTGSIIWLEFTGEKLEQANITKQKMLYLYHDDSHYFFMNQTDFQQIEIPTKQLEWEKNFLAENSEVNISFFNDEILGVSLPDLVALEVEFAEDAVQGNTVTNIKKKARLVTGYELEVPQFIKTGDFIVVSTVDGAYKERAAK